jgi:hypothetical protein
MLTLLIISTVALMTGVSTVEVETLSYQTAIRPNTATPR